MEDRTYIQGNQLTFAQVLALFEKLKGRPATTDEKQRLRAAWLRKQVALKPRK